MYKRLQCEDVKHSAISTDLGKIAPFAALLDFNEGEIIILYHNFSNKNFCTHTLPRHLHAVQNHVRARSDSHLHLCSIANPRRSTRTPNPSLIANRRRTPSRGLGIIERASSRMCCLHNLLCEENYAEHIEAVAPVYFITTMVSGHVLMLYSVLHLLPDSLRLSSPGHKTISISHKLTETIYTTGTATLIEPGPCQTNQGSHRGSTTEQQHLHQATQTARQQ